MVIDGFNEAIGEFLHFVFHIAQLILGQSAGAFEFLRFVECGSGICWAKKNFSTN